MAYIKVDHSQFEKTAAQIDKYVELLRDKMKRSQGEVTTLAATWQGADYTQFKSQFDQVDNGQSTHTQMVKALESYSKYLKAASAKYQEAQTKAVNRANSLPRY